MPIIDTKKKATTASNRAISALHSEKQKGIAKWKSYLNPKNTNPDLYVLAGAVVVHLDHFDPETYDSPGTVYKDKSGHYYGEIVPASDQGGDDIPPQPERGLPPTSDDEDD
ncbi:hypothetical protein MNO14_10290 [Luteimonas sp. S4-F44]|uniref:hypothetical protein n=1 Tax=Luteimonas sp. S4-F44 TaxID=2925842 RepID=UPI001F531573|nr:hypothetical protein [Luteimonas sp. S4-F44]UNK41369.1 hypothetical protein MNO14_10290 [Luteimonas sp. S4-F44]